MNIYTTWETYSNCDPVSLEDKEYEGSSIKAVLKHLCYLHNVSYNEFSTAHYIELPNGNKIFVKFIKKK